MVFHPQMKPEHASAFQAAAKWFNLYILVRRTNARSLAYIGDAKCVPKRLDCKAKTADCDYVHPRFGQKNVAGLVVDPTIMGRSAFSTDSKFASAQAEWAKFAKLIDDGVRTHESQSKLTYVPNGKFYFVDLNPDSPRYGCVKFSSSSLMTAGKYIYGDFDLYGIVPAANPSRNVAVAETRLGERHSRSPEFLDVQIYINGKLGVPMVLHGAQESFASAHSEEGIDIFHPDGTITGCENALEIKQLYETVFAGRKLFTKDGPRDIVNGKFMAAA